ncbi:MAG TPA: hypothetical protein VGF45_20410, partial [Polyangia bacterium]
DSSYKTDLLARLEEAGLHQRPVFTPYTGTRMALEDDQSKAVKKALALVDWIEEVPTREIEDRYQTWAGSLKRIGEEYAWLCEGLAAMCAACGWGPAWRRTVEVLGERLSYGVKEDALEIMRLRVPRLSRGMAAGLRTAGLLELQAIREVPEGAVRKAVGRRGVADALVARAGAPKASIVTAKAPQLQREDVSVVSGCYEAPPRFDVPRAADDADSAYGEKPGTVAPSSVDLVIDLRTRQVVLFGQAIREKPPRNLSPQLFLALAALGSEPGRVVAMADLAKAIHRLGRLSRKPVAPDPRDLRYRLLRSLRKALADTPYTEKLQNLVETVPGFGLRLTCTASVLNVDVE